MNNSEQDTLFGKKVISSINYDEQEIIRDILYLHCDGKDIDCDPTYSIGVFYKNGLRKPKHKFDKFPQSDDVIEACAEDLPLDNESIGVMMFDPPFVISGETYLDNVDGSSIIAKRFERFKNFYELKKMYALSLKEAYRVLIDNGIMIFKCQDTVSSGKQHITHSWIISYALKTGFHPKDLFILLSKNRLVDGRKQQHARKFHSYYLVLKKSKNKVDYSLCDYL